MIKMGLIGAGVGFVYMMSLTLLHPFCTLCLVPFLGIGVGYGAGWFDHPLDTETSLGKGALAGGLTGFGAVLGQMLATVVSGILVTNSEQLPLAMRELGLSQFMFSNNGEYWRTILILNSLCSLSNLALMVGLGAVGSLIWFQRHQRALLAVSS
jgi:hypothetical protein